MRLFGIGGHFSHFNLHMWQELKCKLTTFSHAETPQKDERKWRFWLEREIGGAVFWGKGVKITPAEGNTWDMCYYPQGKHSQGSVTSTSSSVKTFIYFFGLSFFLPFFVFFIGWDYGRVAFPWSKYFQMRRFETIRNNHINDVFVKHIYIFNGRVSRPTLGKVSFGRHLLFVEYDLCLAGYLSITSVNNLCFWGTASQTLLMEYAIGL